MLIQESYHDVPTKAGGAGNMRMLYVRKPQKHPTKYL